MNLRRTLLCCLAPLALSACAVPPMKMFQAEDAPMAAKVDPSIDVDAVTRQAADVLVDKIVDFPGLTVSEVKQAPIIVASIADVQHINKTSALGRLLTEQVMTTLSQRGFLVKESRLSSSLSMSSDGQFLMTDKAKKMAREVHAAIAADGTYTFLNDRVYVSLRLMRLSDGAIIASEDYSMPTLPNEQ